LLITVCLLSGVALFGCLTNLVNSSPTELADVEFFCFAPGRARAIGLRLKQLYQDLSDAFRGWNTSSEYILRGGLDFYLFEKHHSIVRFRALANQESLYAELAAPRWVFTSLNFDRYALEDDLLPSIYHRNRAGVIQVFYLHSEEGAKVFILDERGSLYYHLHDPLGPERILKSYALFLGATLQRYILTASEIEYYLVESLGRGGYSVRPAGFQPYPLDNILEIRVFTQEIAGCGTAYSILCNDLEFSSMESGEDVFAQAAAYILQLRHSGEHYPIYITDIDVPLATLGGDTPDQLQSIHFLNYKLKIEQYLNQ
jgi:adenylate cyclase class 1